MKKVIKKSVMLLLLCIPFFLCSCNNDVQLFTSNIPTFDEHIKSLGYWKSKSIDSKPKSVTIELQRDADFLVWTKENGEVLSPPIPAGKKYKDVMSAKKGITNFIFKDSGTYILNIYQKADVSSNFNIDNYDFRGKVYISDQAIKINVEDDNAPSKCPRQAIFSIQNDSYELTKKTQETVMSELIYIDYDEELTKEKRKNYKNTFYKTCFRYTNLANTSLNDEKKGKSIVLLFPMRINNTIDRGGFILKAVKNKGQIIYYGQPTNRDELYSQMGTNKGQIINTFTPISENIYETQWK